MKSITNILSPILALWFTTTVALADPPSIQRVILDDHTVASVPVAVNRVTTISFPGPIEAMDGTGFTVDGKTPGQFQLAHAKGSAFLSVRALAANAVGNLNIRWNHRTYVFELTASDTPVLSLTMESPATPEESGVGRTVEVSPLKLLALLDKAKAFPLLKLQQPESVADVAFTAYDGKPLVSDFNDYEIKIEQAFRFNADDTLIFRAGITNKTSSPLLYQPDSFSLRAGNRLYPQSISDASGTVPPQGNEVIYFAVTGTPDGGRNELSLKNNFTVLVQRVSPPPKATITNVPSFLPPGSLASPTNSKTQLPTSNL